MFMLAAGVSPAAGRGVADPARAHIIRGGIGTQQQRQHNEVGQVAPVDKPALLAYHSPRE